MTGLGIKMSVVVGLAGAALALAALPGSSSAQEPGPWGLFELIPVVDGKSVIPDTPSPWPDTSGGRTFTATGGSAYGEIAKAGFRHDVVPEPFVRSMQVNGLHAGESGEQWYFRAFLATPEGEPERFSVEIDAFTPPAPVPFDTRPHLGLYKFRTTNEVRGYPTLATMPNPELAAPNSERVVAWSQSGVAYEIRTTGTFTDEEVLELARAISEAQEPVDQASPTPGTPNAGNSPSSTGQPAGAPIMAILGAVGLAGLGMAARARRARP